MCVCVCVCVCVCGEWHSEGFMNEVGAACFLSWCFLVLEHCFAQPCTLLAMQSLVPIFVGTSPLICTF